MTTRRQFVQSAASLGALSAVPAGALAQALAQLSREQCEALLLQIEGELSVENIAAITRSTNEATLGHLSQARAKLQPNP